jgi:DNA-3-methyladenine glycosylase II
MTVVEAELTPRGAFSLKAAAEFGFGPNEGRPERFDGSMRLAFPVDGGTGYAGAMLRQPESDGALSVRLHLSSSADPDAALGQVARVVSLDYDGEEFARVGKRDSVIGALQSEHRGQRPVLFYSPYECAAWGIIAARRSARQASTVRTALAAEHGAAFELAGRTLHAFPQAERLIEIADDAHGLSAERVAGLRGVARAALAGELEVDRLRARGPELAFADVQRLKGLGPFYAGLVVVRSAGFADALLPVAEPRLLAHAARFYGLERRPTFERFVRIAEPWRPFRTWATVLMRLAGDRGTVVRGRNARR